nr:hypothetical protein [Neisseria sp. N177_16]
MDDGNIQAGEFVFGDFLGKQVEGVGGFVAEGARAGSISPPST